MLVLEPLVSNVNEENANTSTKEANRKQSDITTHINNLSNNAQLNVGSVTITTDTCRNDMSINESSAAALRPPKRHIEEQYPEIMADIKADMAKRASRRQVRQYNTNLVPPNSVPTTQAVEVRQVEG